VTAKYANHAKKEADWGFPSRIWRISRLNLFASCRRPILGGKRLGAGCTNKPNLGVPGREEGCRCEQTKPNLGGLGYLGAGTRGSQSCETNPIPSAGRKSQVLAGKRVMVN
jgi:hypothetical protein